MNKKAQAMFSNITLLVIFLVVISISGILAGMIYFSMTTIETTLHSINFQIPKEINGTSNITNFQDILGITIYPLLGLRTSLPYLTYFLIFGFIIALAVTSYVSSKNPIFFVVHMLFTILITYFCLIISNMYVDLLSNGFINNLMINFSIYNKIMIYLPQIVFFTSLLFGVIAFINVIKPQTQSSPYGINYGGDY